MTIIKEHNKLYAKLPKVLTIVCDKCHARYAYEFVDNINEELWSKELKLLQCPKCGKKRL